ncbi:helix-turn-helix transcriptional regulator [Caballeronia humi]|uniref:LuxR family transcriptional regulator n=1 Tax=Caballeronia humi TaxID=326474 RepID=A0A158IKD9_9BURK|nr:LuxR family transcriptional regulator [Caballeronia humi]SAL57102.1 LuxR family transcriptional regulator [Caballeronia humi]
MYLSAAQSRALAKVMAALVEPFDEADVRARVGDSMLELLGAQYYASYVWDAAENCFEKRVQINMDPGDLARYESHYQYHDPITPKLQRYRRAVHVNEVMPQEALVRTEFYNDFLAKSGLYRGINLYVWERNRNIGDMRIWRDRRRPDFSRDDLALLELIRPALCASLGRSQPVDGVQRQVEKPLQRADAALSERERQIACLIVRDMSDKEIARHLNIAPTTVRTHIMHAFRKLNVNSRLKLAQCVEPLTGPILHCEDIQR